MNPVADGADRWFHGGPLGWQPPAREALAMDFLHPLGYFHTCGLCLLLNREAMRAVPMPKVRGEADEWRSPFRRMDIAADRFELMKRAIRRMQRRAEELRLAGKFDKVLAVARRGLELDRRCWKEELGRAFFGERT